MIQIIPKISRNSVSAFVLLGKSLVLVRFLVH